MNRICPFSMAGEPTECYREDCVAWSDGECSTFEREPLSQYFTAKNMKRLADEANHIKEEMKWQR